MNVKYKIRIFNGTYVVMRESVWGNAMLASFLYFADYALAGSTMLIGSIKCLVGSFVVSLCNSQVGLLSISNLGYLDQSYSQMVLCSISGIDFLD